jgi:hypothetical protein
MITFNKIGYMGRLGNQMFQYASLMGVANKTGYDFGIPIIINSKIELNGCYDKYLNKWIPYKLDLLDCFNLSAVDSSDISNNEIFFENKHEFNPDTFNIKDFTDLNGYFQTEKYFKHISEDIIREFTFKSEIINECLKIKSNYENIVSIHFRRGDYLGDTNKFPLLDLDYYQSAINMFNDKEYIFFIFSDDIKWCKNIFGNNERIIYIEEKNQFIDMCLMSMCDHNIIANSTFSWWGAWLNNNPNKKVIGPKKWFGPELSHLNEKDIIPNNWIKI